VSREPSDARLADLVTTWDLNSDWADAQARKEYTEGIVANVKLVLSTQGHRRGGLGWR
jgi:hypothetical protein